MKRLTCLAFLAAAVVLVTPLAASAAPPAGSDRSSYIVVLAGPGDLPAAAAAAQSAGGTIGYEYHNVFTGFSAELPAAAADGLAHNPRVVSIEPDGVVTASTTQAPAPSWGLDRVDQHPLPLNNSYSYTTTGSGVKAYIVDTGIRSTHTDLGGRVIAGYTAISDRYGTSDCNGHGTHVSGTVGGTTYGIAKAVTLVPVRVLNCQGSGSWSGVVAGIDWAVGNHTSGPAVLNMSLGGGADSTVDTAVKRATDDGITVVVAAGNSNADACNYSPARAPTALTVGATESNDARASYSNYGNCVDLFAPGSSITSDWNTSNTATNTISGTSMASPHTTGVAARYLQANPGASPDAVATALKTAATGGAVTSPGPASPNLLLWADPGGGSAPPVTRPDPPTAVTATPGNASALVSWTPPANNGGSSITGYTVTSSPGSLHCPPSGTATSCTVAGLTNGTSYTFTVVATNTAGSSVPSTASSAVTPNPPPPGPAFTLTATGTKVKGDKQVNLTWSPTGTPATVDIRRDGVVVAGSIANSGSYGESLGKGSGTYTYQVCNVGSSTTCSNQATVVF